MNELVHISNNEDAIIFDDEKGLVAILEYFYIPSEEIRELMIHERAHYEKARELGFPANYCILYKHENGKIKSIRPAVVTDDKGMSLEQRISVTSAPLDLSLRDIDDLKKLKDLR
ncbi:MAG: hypothetical protein Q8N88_05785 [Nanoarchaeota archaeon]|nr:hypothetical protein [Nanoarchaeota archaeon]